MRDDDSFSREVADRQRDVFRMFVGQGRRVSYAALSSATTISISTLKAYADGVAMPLHNLLRLVPALPREAANMLIEPSGHLFTPIDAHMADWLDLGAKACAFGSKVLRYERTGPGIDPSEAADLKKDIREMIADGQGVL
jgi:hypothetical protein